MKTFGFILHHGYTLYKGYIEDSNKEEAEKRILNKEYNDIIDEYNTDDLQEGYKIIEMWEC